MFYKRTDAPPPPDWRDWPVTTDDKVMARVGATVIWDRQIDYLINVVKVRLVELKGFEDTARVDGIGSWYNRHEFLLEWERNALIQIKEYIVGEEQRLTEKYNDLEIRMSNLRKSRGAIR